MPPVKVPKKPLKVMEKVIEKPLIRTKKKNYQSFSIYLYKLLRSEAKENLGISRKAMLIMNDFMIDMLEKICQEAGRMVVHGKKRTMGSADVQSAVKLLIPGELATHANIEATKAIIKFHKSHEGDAAR